MAGPSADIVILGWSIHLYSLMLAAGLLFGFVVARRFALKKGIAEKDFDTTILLILALGFLGARLFFVLGHWDEYFAKHVGEIIMFWRGGLAFYGGLIGGAAGLAAARLKYKYSFFNFLDALALGLPIGQAVGRWGNYFNQEAYGRPTDLPWGIYIDPSRRLAGFESYQYFHPTFAYESLGLILLFAVLFTVSRKNNYVPGVIFGTYAFFSGALRVVIEQLRVDALMLAGLKISQLVAIVLMIIGLLVLISLRKNAGKIS